jgi:FSR family fosmidomycin resistance protein-like MFS transporter
MAFFAQTMGISNSEIGIVIGGYALTSAISQPLFGWLIDRIGPRWIASGGVFWTAGFISFGLVLNNTSSLPLLIVAGLGSGAFHPAGTMEASRRGQEHFVGKAATAAALFFLFGQTAYSVGPAIGGVILENFEAPGLLVLTALAIPSGLYAIRQLPSGSRSEVDATADISSKSSEHELHAGWLAWMAFILLVALRSWAYGNLAGFIPKYMIDAGIELRIAGLIAALYMGGSAIGNLAGGAISDRWGKRIVIYGSLFLVSAAMYAFVQSGTSNWIYLFSFLSGIFIGASQSALVVLAQNLMPNRMATASGLVLGFMFSTEAIGIYLSGLIADATGLVNVFRISPLLTLIAALLALTLKTNSQKSRIAMETHL